MSNVLNNILQQKLMEIQGQLPAFVKLVKDESVPFSEVLTSEVDYASIDSPDAIGSVKEKLNYNGNFDEIIELNAKKYNISSSIIKSVIKAESNFNPTVVSSAGAMGLMQLMPATAKSLGVDDAFDPVQNIEGGVKFLKDMLQKFGGNLELALAAYNAGPGNVVKYGGIPPFKETQNYVKKIMGFLSNKTFG
ncbi:MAG: yjbJ [Clostridia bacterium]|jgi:soluble lytic murein transglycosylase-like protein|nr:yjbJ [Clostridia bacterium]